MRVRFRELQLTNFFVSNNGRARSRSQKMRIITSVPRTAEISNIGPMSCV